MPKRDYRAEYRKRIARGLARGLSRSQARGHPKAKEGRVQAVTGKSDAALEAAIRSMNQGTSMTAAARSHHISAERVRRFLVAERIAKKKNRRWAMLDNRPRRMPVLSEGQVKLPLVAGYEQARLVGAHHRAAGEFVRSNDITHLQPFEGKSVRTVGGKKLPLETDPNALHRIASMDMPVFHEIYEIVSAA